MKRLHCTPTPYTINVKGETVPVYVMKTLDLGRFTLRKKSVPISQKTGWFPSPVCVGADNLVQPGFDSQTVQPVADRYTD